MWMKAKLGVSLGGCSAHRAIPKITGLLPLLLRGRVDRMSAEAQINSLIMKFREMRERANTILEKAVLPQIRRYMQVNVQTKALIESYETARSMFAVVSKGQSVPTFLQYDQSVSDVGQLQKLSIECAAAMGFLETLRSPIPTADKDRLDSLRKEIASLEAFNENLFKHVNSAISEYEQAHYLASALLAGKSVVYIWEQFPGQGTESKASNLVQSGLLKGDLKGQFLKGEKKARDYFTHDISAIPQPQEALALVTDACNLSIMLEKLKSSDRSARQ